MDTFVTIVLTVLITMIISAGLFSSIDNRVFGVTKYSIQAEKLIELYPIHTHVWLLWDNEIVEGVVKEARFHTSFQFPTKFQYKLLIPDSPFENYITDLIDANKVFESKEELLKSLSDE